MKAFSLRVVVLSIAVIFSVGSFACKPKDTGDDSDKPAATGSDVRPAATGSDVKDPGTTGSAVENPAGSAQKEPEPADSKTPAGSEEPKITHQQYWEIQIERTRTIKEYWAKQLAVYEKHGGDTPEAQEEILGLRDEHQKAMQKVFEDFGIQPRDFFIAPGNDRAKTMRERQMYLTENQELQQEYKKIREELNEYRKKVMDITGRTGPGSRNQDETQQ